MHRPTDRPGKVTKACIDAGHEQLCEVIRAAPPPTQRMRDRAVEACAPKQRVFVVPEPDASRAPLIAIGIVLLLVVVLLLTPGCVTDADRALLDTSVGVNMGHARDESLPREAREIGLDNADVAAALRYSLTGDELPPDTRARLERYAAELGQTLEHYPKAVAEEGR